MDRRTPALGLLLTAALTTGCADVRDAVSGAGDCVALADGIARSGLSGVPTQQEAEQALQRLDDRVAGLDDTEVREAATDLRERLRELQEAARAADATAAQQAAARARDAARSTAQACGLPVDRFLEQAGPTG